MNISKKTWIYGGTALALTAGLLWWAFAPRPVEVEVAELGQGLFETAIEEDGKTRLIDRYLVSAPLSGQLSRISLREGDAVAAGAVVAQLMPQLSPLLDARSLRQQMLQVEIAQAQLQRAEARIEVARIARQRAASELQRSEQLLRQGFVATSKVETEALNQAAAAKELDAAGLERQVATHQLAQARSALLAVRSPASLGSAGLFTLRAPSSGQVLRILQGSEASVALGTPLLEIGDTRRLEVVAELLSTEAMQVRLGSPVLIERWGGTGTLRGQVRLIEPAAFTKVSALGVEEQRVKVLIALDTLPEPAAGLGEGYRVGVRILTRRVEGALKLPVSALFPLPQGGMAVFTLVDGRARLTPVRIQARNASEAWLEQGLAKGDRVIVYPPAAVREGQRVAVRQVR